MDKKVIQSQIDFDYGDIAIKRVINGWVVFTGSTHDEDRIDTYVYEEDDNDPLASEKALLRLICEHFDGYTQSKMKGGLQITVEPQGYAYEDED